MYCESLLRHFSAIGARLKFRKVNVTSWWFTPPPYTIDVRRDRRGEYFEISLRDEASDIDIIVLQSVPKERHLLLYATDGHRFLCGHDERHWFVAQVARPVSSVRDARQALVPPDIWERVRGLPSEEFLKRRNVAFKRQGEWFFIPTNRTFNGAVIYRNEPIQRNARSTPHICEELVREGGEVVYVLRRSGRVLTEDEYRDYRNRFRRKAEKGEQRVRSARVYARGRIRHPDHKTLVLEDWHRVLINSEVAPVVDAYGRVSFSRSRFID